MPKYKIGWYDKSKKLQFAALKTLQVHQSRPQNLATCALPDLWSISNDPRQMVEIQKDFKTGLINSMDHTLVSDIEPSSVVLIQTKCIRKGVRYLCSVTCHVKNITDTKTPVTVSIL